MVLACTSMLVMFGFGGPPSGPVVAPDQTIVADSGEDSYRAVAVDGDILLVATGEGEVLAYHQVDGTWQLEETLAPSSPSSTFGTDVAIAGTRVAILDRVNGPYLYQRLESGSWVTNAVDDLTDTGVTFLTVGLVEIDTGDDLAICFDDNGSRGFHTLDFIFEFGVFRWSLSDTVAAPVTATEQWGDAMNLADGRLVIGARGSTAFPQTDGAVYLYDESIPGNWSLASQINPPTATLATSFGAAVSLDDDQLAVGAPGSANFADESTVSLFERDTFGFWGEIATIDGEYNGFGTQVHLANGTLVASSSGSGLSPDYPGYLEIHRYDAVADQWGFLATLRTRSQGIFGVQFGTELAVSDEWIVATDTGGSDDLPGRDGGQEPEPPTVSLYNLDATSSRFWQATGSASIADAAAWTGPNGTNAIFSVPSETPSIAVLDGVTTFDQVVVREIMAFDLSNESSDFGNLRVNGPTNLSPAVATVDGAGTISLLNDLQLGLEGHKGQLILTEDAALEIDGEIRFDPSGTLQVVASGEATVASSGRISGGLNVSLPDGLVPSAGTTYSLIELTSPPSAGEDAFDLVSLPGLPGGLAFELSYGTAAASGGWSASVEVVTLDELLGFGDPESTGVDSGAIDMEVTDLTNDGTDELCVLFAGTPGQLAVFNVNATGDIVEQIIFNVGDDPVGLTSGDLDGDSTTDLALANSNGTVQVLINDDSDPSDGFDITAFAVGALPASEPTCITAAQVDLASTADELVVGFDNGDGTGAFTTYSASTPLRGLGYGESDNHNTSSPAAAANPNEDEGKKDIPWGGTKDDGKVVVAKRTSLLGSGLSISYSDIPAAADLRDIGIRDLDGDGDADVVVTSGANNTLVLLEQDASGTFGAPVSIAAGTGPGLLTTADFNGDAQPDVAVLTSNASSNAVIRIYENNGSFIFTTTDVGEGDDPTLVDAGDVDGDGQADLVSIAAAGSPLRGPTPSLSVRPVCSCLGDSDCDGDVDVEDLLNVLGDYGCSAGCDHDVDENGTVDVEDVLVVIGNWNGCD